MTTWNTEERNQKKKTAIVPINVTLRRVHKIKRCCRKSINIKHLYMCVYVNACVCLRERVRVGVGARVRASACARVALLI
jgi:hypothetical protein